MELRERERESNAHTHTAHDTHTRHTVPGWVEFPADGKKTFTILNRSAQAPPKLLPLLPLTFTIGKVGEKELKDTSHDHIFTISTSNIRSTLHTNHITDHTQRRDQVVQKDLIPEMDMLVRKLKEELDGGARSEPKTANKAWLRQTEL